MKIRLPELTSSCPRAAPGAPSSKTADAAQRGDTPDNVGGQQADNGAHDNLALGAFQKIGQHPGDEYEQNGHGHQLKSLAGLVGIDQAKKEENNRHDERRGVAEVAGATP